MVLIGFDKSIPIQEAVGFLLDNGIVYVGHEFTENVKKYAYQSPIEKDMIYFQVETEELFENGLCSLGRQNEVNTGIKHLIRGCTEDGALLVKELVEVVGSVLARMIDDADMWLSIVKKFALRFGIVALRREYNDTRGSQCDSIIRTAEYINIYYDKVTLEDILSLNINQTIVVRSSVD